MFKVDAFIASDEIIPFRVAVKHFVAFFIGVARLATNERAITPVSSVVELGETWSHAVRVRDAFWRRDKRNFPHVQR